MTQTHLFGDNCWAKIRKRLAEADGLYIFLDYDGTLVPIRRRPSLALLSPAVRSLIRRLSGMPKTFVGIVTGRSLADIRRLVGIRGILYGANHGLELSLNGEYWKHPEADRYRARLSLFRRLLGSRFRGIRGIFVEHKGVTFSVHYREVRRSEIPRVEKIVEDTFQSFKRDIKITPGKKVFDVRPRIRWNKGFAVRRILQTCGVRRGSVVLYMGDDTTDEDAFRLLRTRAITIRVGPKLVAHAAYFLEDPSEVRQALQRILKLRNTTKGGA